MQISKKKLHTSGNKYVGRKESGFVLFLQATWGRFVNSSICKTKTKNNLTECKKKEKK